MFAYLHVDYLFLVGLGCDIAGAYLLAEGLLLPVLQIRSLSSTFVGFNPAEVRARLDDKIDGRFGMSSLVVGFVIQVIGYAVSLGVSSGPARSWTFAAIGILLAAITFAIVLGAHRLARGRLQRRALIELARYNNHGKRMDKPYGALLLVFSDERPIEGETQAEYAKRVWRVNDIIEGGPHD